MIEAVIINNAGLMTMGEAIHTVRQQGCVRLGDKAHAFALVVEAKLEGYMFSLEKTWLGYDVTNLDK